MQKNFTLSVLNIIQPLFVKFGIFVDQIMGFNCNDFVKNI